MTQLTSRQLKNEINYSQNKQLLKYLDQKLQSLKHEELPESLLSVHVDLHSLVERLVEDNKILWDIIKQQRLDQLSEDINVDNFDLDKKQVKDLLLNKIKIKQVFYPSDIANQYGLDLIVVMDAISELKQQGKFVEKPE